MYRWKMSFLLGSLLASILVLSACNTNQVRLDGKDDPHLWLEDVEGEKALGWVEDQNEKTLSEMTKSARYKEMEQKALKILQAQDKIPYVNIKGKYLYNFWQDDKHVRGLWRRTTFKSYQSQNPRWEVVLDLDKLAQKEKENWVFKGANCQAPSYELCLLTLSRGGKDASVIREFNTKTKRFVKNGFNLKEAKSWVSWINRNEVFVSTDFGPGTMTASGYPRLLKVWKRGTSLDKARTIREAKKEHMSVYGMTFVDSQGATSFVSTWKTFFTSSLALYESGKISELPLPESAQIMDVFKGHFLFKLRKAWTLDGTTYPQGSLIAVHSRIAKAGKVTKQDVTMIYAQTDKASMLSATTTRDKILINVLDNVNGKILEVSLQDGQFTKPEAIKFKDNTNLGIVAVSPFQSDYFFRVNGFLNPDALYHYNSKLKLTKKMKSLPARFSSQGMVVKQKWATSRDGTKVPYFVIGKKEVVEKGKAPTLLYGYGGFEVSLSPTYKPVVGKLWLEKGGVYVMANIRGGGEFGPSWHQAALKMNRQKAYDDFIAVGEDLVQTGMTTKDKLAIQGGSNGGLLVGAVMTQRPDLFKAVLCHVPLLDMVRYSQLLAGASWVGEYGDPKDPEMRDYLLGYSPYHNVKEGKDYPELFLLTSTKDDRVHPGHARKMAAKMMSMGHKNIHYYENTEGGHAATANLKQRARMRALTYEFLFKTIQ
jgi:prolyl oligopeptidase